MRNQTIDQGRIQFEAPSTAVNDAADINDIIQVIKLRGVQELTLMDETGAPIGVMTAKKFLQLLDQETPTHFQNKIEH